MVLGRRTAFTLGVSLALVLASTACGSGSDDGAQVGGDAGAPSAFAGAGASAGASGRGGDTASGGAQGGRAGEPGAGASGSAAAAGMGGHSGAGNLRRRSLVATTAGACALDAQGTIHCWGLAPASWAVPSGRFVELQSSTDGVCALREDGTVACFPQPRGTPDLSFAPTGKVESLAMGLGASCSTAADGVATCRWSNEAFAVPAPEGERFQALAVGHQFACGILALDGSLLCWGSPGTDACAGAPAAGQLDAPSGRYVEISSRVFSTCAIDDAASIVCWGAGEAEDDAAALCRGEPFNFGQSTPPEGSFRGLSMGENHGCAVRVDGTIACWGAGTADSCPDAGVDCRQARPPEGVFEQVAAGKFHTCAMKADRTIACWGWDGAGDGRTTPPAVFR